jgi:glycosyltransferase involved in cell wall biosynthesis
MKKNKISVIIPTRLRLELLKIALKSVLTQTEKPLEIIVVDDASQKKVFEYIKKLKRNIKIRILYITRKNYKENSSPASINLGFKKSKSEFIAILDDDDYWEKNYLKVCKETIKKKGCDLVVSPINFILNKKIKFVRKLSAKFNLQKWLVYNPGLICSNIFVKAKTFRKIGMLDGYLPYSADRDFMIRLNIKKYKYSVLRRPLVNYINSSHPLKSNKANVYLKSNFRFYKKYYSSMTFHSHLINLKKLIIGIIFNIFKGF